MSKQSLNYENGNKVIQATLEAKERLAKIVYTPEIKQYLNYEHGNKMIQATSMHKLFSYYLKFCF